MPDSLAYLPEEFRERSWPMAISHPNTDAREGKNHSPCSKRGQQTLRMTSGQYTVVSVPPQESWQETDFSQSRRKSVGEYVSAERPRGQHLSSVSKGTTGTQESLPCSAAGTKEATSQHPNSKSLGSEGSQGFQASWVHGATNTLNLTSEDLTSIIGSASPAQWGTS